MNDLASFLLLWLIVISLSVVVVSALSAWQRTSSYLIASIAGYIVISNVLASKILSFGWFVIPGGIIAYSFIFLFNDVLHEKFGKKVAKRGVYAGLLMNLLFIGMIFITLKAPVLPTPESMEIGEAFSKVFNLTTRILIGSIVAYILSQLFNVYCYHYLKEKTKGKYLWLRNNTSTILSQLIDTVVFILVSFYGILPPNILYHLMLSHYVLKIIIALLDTPLIYMSIYIYDKVSRITKERSL